MKQLALALIPGADLSFDTFCQATNVQAWEVLRQGLPDLPVHLWGPQGSGKSHLLTAVARQARTQGFGVQMFDARTDLPWELWPDTRLIVLEDVDTFDPARQHAAFALLASAPSQRAVWVSSSRLPPVDVTVRDDLRTRLGWGLVFALDVLDEDHTRLVLRQEALRRGWVLNDDVLDHLLLHVERDLVHLMRVLDHLDAGALAEGRAVNLPLVRRLLRTLPRADGHQQENLWSQADEVGLV